MKKYKYWPETIFAAVIALLIIDIALSQLT